MNRRNCRHISRHDFGAHSASYAKKAFVLAAVAFLSGCAGPSTKVLPKRQGGTIQEVPEEIPVVEEVNSFYLQEFLGILSTSPRMAGSREEDTAARYIQRLLKDYGYQVNRQRFREKTEHEEILGTNVIATRPAEDPDADILLICTWHDSAPGSPGAGNNASGVSVFLETARILSGLPTDTEVRFVSLSAHENDALGARIYTRSLSKREKERLIGAITIGPCGALDTEETVLATQDGKGTMLGDLLSDSSSEITGIRFHNIQKAGLENGIFASCFIPAVQIGQKEDSFDFGTPLDTVDTVDAECLSELVDTICHTVSKIMNPDTPSMRAKAHYENNWNTFVYQQEPRRRIPFGSTPGRLQALLGIPGKLAVVNRDSKNHPIERYRFHAKWFEVEEPLITDYYFTDEQLDLVSLLPENQEQSSMQIQSQITSVYGEPEKKISGPYGLDCIWRDPVAGEQIELIPGKESFEVEIRSYTPEKTILARYDAAGNAEEKTENFEAEYGYLTQLCSVIFQPESEEALPAPSQDAILGRLLPKAELLYETDGAGGDHVLTERLKQTADVSTKAGKTHSGQKTSRNDSQGEQDRLYADTSWQVTIDPENYPQQDGELADRSTSLKSLMRTYGILLKETDPELYANGYGELLGEKQAMQQSEDASLVSPKSALQAESAQGMNQTVSVSLPEFEDAFALYVLADDTSDSPGAFQECVRYFNQFEELNTYRSAVRNYLGLQTEE